MRKSIIKASALSGALFSALSMFANPNGLLSTNDFFSLTPNGKPLVLRTSSFRSTPNDYVRTHTRLAVMESLRSNIPASVIMAQAIFESKWGESELARRSNNHFGIKAHSWNGSVEYAKDDDRDNRGRLIPSAFRKYESVEMSYVDHTEFLQNIDRYRILFSYERTDYKNWAMGLSKCGYATDPNYGQNLIKLIEMYELYKLDIPQSLFTETSLQANPYNVKPKLTTFNQQLNVVNNRVAETEDGTLFEITANLPPSGDGNTERTKGLPSNRGAAENEFYEITSKTGTQQSTTTRTTTSTKILPTNRTTRRE